jgi:hypothetical protein
LGASSRQPDNGRITQPEGGNPLTDWFRSVQREIADDYDRLHREALNDPQCAGHGAEATWKGVLAQWLPDGYGVEARKYIIPEVGTEIFETDLVVLRPSYPRPLHRRAKILAGGVAAAFSVKQTLDAEGIVDGADRAMRLRRAMKPRNGTPREQMLAPFPVGLLANSHCWEVAGLNARKERVRSALANSMKKPDTRGRDWTTCA